MKALTWHGKGDIRCESVPEPRIEHPRDAVIKVTACAICGSDLHIYGGLIPSKVAAARKLRTTIANVTPAAVLAEQHRKQAEPGSGNR